jgi:hypothetical protein
VTAAVAVDRATGRLQASAETIEALKRLVEQEAVELGEGSPRAASSLSEPVVVRVAPAPADDEIEALLGSLMIETYVKAMQAFRLADANAQPGGQVETYSVAASSAVRLTRACAEVATALMRSRGKCERVVVQYIKGGQVVGVVNK